MDSGALLCRRAHGATDASANVLSRSVSTRYNGHMERPVENETRLQHADVTRAILKCAFEVASELGAGFLESVYERAMEQALREAGLSVARQTPIDVRFRGQSVGDFYADLLVEHVVIVELKAVQALLPEHKAQVINYLRATDIEVGLLINFGRPRLEYHRLTRAITRDQGALPTH
jgi:GxxExxY protein